MIFTETLAISIVIGTSIFGILWGLVNVVLVSTRPSLDSVSFALVDPWNQHDGPFEAHRLERRR